MTDRYYVMNKYRYMNTKYIWSVLECSQPLNGCRLTEFHSISLYFTLFHSISLYFTLFHLMSLIITAYFLKLYPVFTKKIQLSTVSPTY